MAANKLVAVVVSAALSRVLPFSNVRRFLVSVPILVVRSVMLVASDMGVISLDQSVLEE